MKMPYVHCPKCGHPARLDDTLTAQSNQNVIFTCPICYVEVRNIETDKG